MFIFKHFIPQQRSCKSSTKKKQRNIEKEIFSQAYRTTNKNDNEQNVQYNKNIEIK